MEFLRLTEIRYAWYDEDQNIAELYNLIILERLWIIELFFRYGRFYCESIDFVDRRNIIEVLKRKKRLNGY